MKANQPRFEHSQAMRIAGLRGHFTSASLGDIPALWKRLVSSGQAPSRTSPVDYAVVVLLPDGCNYLAGFQTSESATLPADFDSTETPAHEYAVFSHAGHVSKLNETFDFALNHWLPESSFEIEKTADGSPYALERYGEGFDPKTGLGDMEIWVPIRR